MWVEVQTPEGKRRVAMVQDKEGLWVSYGGQTFCIAKETSFAGQGQGMDDGSQCVAPLTGRVVQVAVNSGDTVEADALLVVLEAMKMEYRLCAVAQGTVQEVLVAEGDQVDKGAIMVKLEVS